MTDILPGGRWPPQVVSGRPGEDHKAVHHLTTAQLAAACTGMATRLTRMTGLYVTHDATLPSWRVACMLHLPGYRGER